MTESACLQGHSSPCNPPPPPPAHIFEPFHTAAAAAAAASYIILDIISILEKTFISSPHTRYREISLLIQCPLSERCGNSFGFSRISRRDIPLKYFKHKHQKPQSASAIHAAHTHTHFFIFLKNKKQNSYERFPLIIQHLLRKTTVI